MSIIPLLSNAVQNSYTPDTTLVLEGDSPSLSSLTVTWHADGVANTGNYISPTATIRISHTDFDKVVKVFSNGSINGISLSYENTQKKNNVRLFTCPGVSVSFPGTVTISAPLDAVQQPTVD